MRCAMYFSDGSRGLVNVDPNRVHTIRVPILGGDDKRFDALTRWGVVVYVERPQLDDSTPTS